MWCRRRRPRRRKPTGLEKVPATWWCQARHLTSLRRSPLVKTRRRSKEALPPPSEGRKEEEGHPNGGGRGVKEKEDPSAGLLSRRRRGRRGVAGQNQASGDIVSIYIPE